MTESILVTGGAGFIGSNFVRKALESTPYRVIVLDKKSFAESLPTLHDVSNHPRFIYVGGNIGDPATAVVLMEHRPVHVVHLAGETGGGCTLEPEPFFYTNVIGTLSFLETVKSYFVSLPEPDRLRFRFVQVSSDEVYGSARATGSLTERSPIAPTSLYGASKAAGEHVALVYWKTCGLPVIVVNPPNTFGPYQSTDKLIPAMLMNAVAGKPLSLREDGNVLRDWIFVEDHCSAIMKVLEKGTPGEKYNVSGGNDLRITDVVDRICELLEKELPAAKNRIMLRRDVRSYTDLKTFSKEAPLKERRAFASSRIRSELEWRPKYTFETGLTKTIGWYLKNQGGLEKPAAPSPVAVPARSRLQFEQK